MASFTHCCSWSGACFCSAWPRNFCLQLYFLIGFKSTFVTYIIKDAVQMRVCIGFISNTLYAWWPNNAKCSFDVYYKHQKCLFISLKMNVIACLASKDKRVLLLSFKIFLRIRPQEPDESSAQSDFVAT